MAFTSCRRLLWRPGLWPGPWPCLGRRLGAAALAGIVALQPLWAHAQAVGRQAVLVVDGNTGRSLYQMSADQLRHPASLTKLMTLYLLFELIEQGRISLTSTIRFSANAVAVQPSRLEVEEGTEINVSDAIKALIVKSANDVAIAIAERIAGSEERFAELMTRKAHELGMKSTEFRNASGLPDPEQVTTARDMAVLALRLYDQFPRYYRLFATPTFTWGGETFRNHNTLLFSYQGLEGMKTGYIRAAGFNLVAAARRGKKHVVVAYFGGKTAALRNAAVRAHLDAAFAKASETKTRRPAPLLVGQSKAVPTGRQEGRQEGHQAKGAAVAMAPPAPQPAVRPSAAPEVEVARVRPVRATMVPPALAPETSPKAPKRDEEPEPPSSRAAAADPADETDSAPLGAASAGPSASAPNGPFHVQIGAFQTKDEAERQLAWARERAGPVLEAHASHMTQVKRGDKVLFRARYVGFPAQAAAAGVCSRLKRMEIDCLVMKAE